MPVEPKSTRWNSRLTESTSGAFGYHQGDTHNKSYTSLNENNSQKISVYLSTLLAVTYFRHPSFYIIYTHRYMHHKKYYNFFAYSEQNSEYCSPLKRGINADNRLNQIKNTPE